VGDDVNKVGRVDYVQNEKDASSHIIYPAIGSFSEEEGEGVKYAHNEWNVSQTRSARRDGAVVLHFLSDQIGRRYSYPCSLLCIIGVNSAWRLIASLTNVVGRRSRERRRKKDHLWWSGTSSIHSDVEVIYLPKLFSLLLIHIH
jgi:hypothetical protein